MQGEYESMKVLHTVTPDFAPKPIAWGTFKSNHDLHFSSAISTIWTMNCPRWNNSLHALHNSTETQYHRPEILGFM